jgi:hypothetical protein
MGAVAVWPVQEAKAKFSELLNTCLADGSQVASKQPTLKDLLLTDDTRFEIDLPMRNTKHFQLFDVPIVNPFATG